MSRRFLFIINPKAGTGGKTSIAKTIQHWLETNKINGEVVFTEYAGHAIEIASRSKEETIVVAVGGDGTVNEVCRGLMQSRQTLGIIPCGSGNGLARHLEIPLNMESSLQNLLNGPSLALDVLNVNGHISVNVSGIGFDAAVAESFAEGKGRGLKNYIKIMLKLYHSFPEFQIIKQDKRISAWMISICNSSQYGNDAFISPTSKTDDGTFELAFLRKPRIIDIPYLAYRMMCKKITDSQYYACVSAKRYELELQESQPLHVDGEYIGREQHLVVEILEPIRVIAGGGTKKIDSV